MIIFMILYQQSWRIDGIEMESSDSNTLLIPCLMIMSDSINVMDT
jgi:hypothetical protein